MRKAIQLYDVIETVDSIKLAKKISSIAGETEKTQRIYLQVNSGKDPLKKGFSLNCKIKNQLLKFLRNCQKDIVQEKVVIPEY